MVLPRKKELRLVVCVLVFGAGFFCDLVKAFAAYSENKGKIGCCCCSVGEGGGLCYLSVLR